jgi:hypothetical protein
MVTTMILSIVTDEISADLETVIELGAEWGISQFELRGFGAATIVNFSFMPGEAPPDHIPDEILETYILRRP